MKKILLILVGFFTLAFSASCTRTVNQKMSFQLQLPSDLGANKVGSMAVTAADLAHLIINVSGPGISPNIYFSWDSNDGANTPPSTFSLDVPQGSSRLVQVLAVYKDGGNQVFYYGDVANLSTQSANTSVTITVESISTTIGEGQIAGRYINSMSGTGPTGKITTKFTPPGRPAMTIDTSEIFGGFFRAFALEGAYLDYILDNGENMFGGPVDINTPYLLDYATQVYMPDYYQSRGPSTYELRKESYLVLGWFAPSAIQSSVLGTKSVCVPDTPISPEIQGAYIDNSGADIPIEWDLDAFNQAGIGVNEFEDADFLCAPSTGARFVDFLSVDHLSLGNHDQPLAFKGPYKLRTHDDGYGIWREVLEVNFSTANGLRLKWDYLPGVITSGGMAAIDGSDIFWRANINPSTTGGGDEEYRTDGGYNCAGLSSYGFQLLHSNAADAANLNEDVSISSLPTGFNEAFNDGRIDLVMCPYANTSSGKKYFQAGTSYHSYPGGTPATEFEIVKLSGDLSAGLNAYNGVCSAFLLRGANGWLSNVDVIFSPDSGLETFDDPDCPFVVPSASWLPWFGDGVIFYIKNTGVGPSSKNLIISDNTGNGIADLNVVFNFDDVGTPSEQALILAPTTIKKYGCYPINILMRDTSNASAMLPIGSTDSRDFDWPQGISGLSFYTFDPSCMGPPDAAAMTSIYTAQNTSYDQVFFRYTGSSSTLNLTPTISTGSAVPFAGATVTVTSPGAPKRFGLMIPQSIPGYSCTDFTLELQDASGYATGATSSFNVTLGQASSQATFYYADSGGACSCDPPEEILSPVTFAVGDSSKHLCYQTSSGGYNEGVSASGTHSGVSIQGSTSFSVDP